MQLKPLIFLFLFGIIACNKQSKTVHQNKAPQAIVKHAMGFSIEKFSGFSILKVSNVFPNSNKTYTYILHKKGISVPDSLQQHTQIEVPIKRIIATSTTHIPALETLGVATTLVGFPSISYISSVTTRGLIDAGKVKDLGNNQELNTELILDLNVDVLVGYSVNGPSKSYMNLEKNGVKVLFNSDWTEQTPLGRAEWLKFFGALYDKDDEAALIFDAIEKSYHETALLAKKATTIPTVFAGAIYEDKWFMPQGDSWAAHFIKEANAKYLWGETKGTGSLSLSFEHVLEKAQHADYWIGPGQFTSINEMQDSNANYLFFEAVKKKKVFSFSTKKGKTGGVLYFELAQNRPDLVLKDMVKILHPNLLPNYQLTFFEQLN